MAGCTYLAAGDSLIRAHQVLMKRLGVTQEEGQSSKEALLRYINLFKGPLSNLVMKALAELSGLDGSTAMQRAAVLALFVSGLLRYFMLRQHFFECRGHVLTAVPLPVRRRGCVRLCAWSCSPLVAARGLQLPSFCTAIYFRLTPIVLPPGRCRHFLLLLLV